MKRTPMVPDFGNMKTNVSQQTATKCTFSKEVGGPVNTLSANKDNSMIVVAGRTILKVYLVEEASFTEKVNMRVGRRQGLNLSCADVAWNHINENLIATAATNGAIIAWDLSATNRNKQYALFTEHKRTVTKVCFHSTEPARLLSGSQDCTMKMFDIRKKECVASFASKSDGVRCVQFCPHEYYHFAASFDNGSVQVWDYRQTNTCLLQFIAHKGSVYTMEWHPDPKEKQRLATGGRDNMIKIWDMIDHKMQDNMVIPTNSPVAVARWRSQRKEQIASAAMMLDHSINVWDVRRKYMPFAQFTEHTDVGTGLLWKKSDPDILFSCSKDGTLYQHTIRDASRPSEHCNLSGLSLSARGFIGYAGTESTNSYDTQPNTKTKSHGRFGFRGVVGVNSNLSQKGEGLGYISSQSNILNSKFLRFLNNKSDLGIYTEKNSDLDLSMSSFIHAAENYKLEGVPFTEVCDYNASITNQLRLSFDSNIWNYLKLFFGGMVAHKSDQTNAPPFHSSAVDKTTVKSTRESLGHVRNAKQSLKNGIMTGESNGEESEQHSDPETEHYLTDIAKGHATSEQECYYSEEDDVTSDMELGGKGMLGGISSGPDGYLDQHDWLHMSDQIRDTTLPTEAFQRRLVLQTAEGLDAQMGSMASGDEETVVNTTPITIPTTTVKHISNDKWKRKHSSKNMNALSVHSQSSSPTEHLSVSPVVYIKSYDTPFLPLNKKLDLIASMFLTAMESGQNIQIVTCSIIVLNHYFPSIKLPIDDQLQEYWQTSYLDIVSRYELWNHYAKIINLSQIPSINNMNSSCNIQTSCGCCMKRMPKSHPWICSKHTDNDHKALGLDSGLKCALCQTIVKSLYVWCQGCCHGGHLSCMKKWFNYPKSRGQCPTGCGHICVLPK